MPDREAPPVYLDNNATTKMAPEVVAAMAEVLGDGPANASAVHAIGQRARYRVNSAREDIAKQLGASPHEIVFTGSGTEADNLAVAGALEALSETPAGRDGVHLVTTTIEHPAVDQMAIAIAGRGVRVTRVPCTPEGFVEPDAVAAAIDESGMPGAATLVSVIAAHNETGAIQPVAEIAAIAKERGALVHTDAVQLFGKAPVVPREWGVDLAVLAPHKFHGPLGIGVLYVRAGTPLAPILFGGGQERGLRPATENVASIVGTARAVDLAVRGLHLMDGVRDKRDRLWASIESLGDAVRFTPAGARGLPNTVFCGLRGISGERLAILLDLSGVCVSTGSACSSGAAHASAALRAMGVSAEVAATAIRLSLCRDTTDADIDAAIDALRASVAKLRK